jgi:hypothetical protein
MENHLTTHIGNLAVEKEYITKEQLEECIQQLDAEESEKQIDQILVEQNLISSQKLDGLKKKRKMNIMKIEANAVLDYIQKMKIIPHEKIKRALNVQNKAQQEQKKYIPLSVILVSHGLISQDRFNEISKSQEVRRKVKQTVWSDDPRRTGLVGRVLGG